MTLRERASDFIWNGVGGPPWTEFEVAKRLYRAAGTASDGAVTARLLWQYLGEIPGDVEPDEAAAAILVRDWLTPQCAPEVCQELFDRFELQEEFGIVSNPDALRLFMACFPRYGVHFLRARLMGDAA